jgi:hypothetical protein
MRRVILFSLLGLLIAALFAVGAFLWLGTPDPRVRAGAPLPKGLLTDTPVPIPTDTLTQPPKATATPSATPSPTVTAIPTTCSVSFVDVPPTDAFYGYIHCLVCRGIVGGYPCGGPGEPCPGQYYRPGNNVTRGQVSKIVSSAAGFAEPVPPTRQTFADIPPSSTFWLWIERLTGRGIVGGYPCGSAGEPCIAPLNRPYFRPNGDVTRGQLSKIVSGAAGYTETPTGQTFVDVAPSDPFYLYVERIAARGTINGYPCGAPGEPCPGSYFRPNNSATRGQMSKIASQTFYPGCAPCGPDWRIVPSASPATTVNQFQDVAAISAGDLWAVGIWDAGASNFQPLIEHWNGTTWSVVPSPAITIGVSYLQGVGVASAGDVWAVGAYWNGTAMQPLIEHWDGTTWAIVPSPGGGPNPAELWSVAAVSANDVWAVGRYLNSASQTLVEHWDGTSWSIVPSPTPGLGETGLFSVAAVSANDVWAVGGYRDSGFNRTLVEHWNGTAWSIIPSPNGPASDAILRDVAVVNATDLWAVGYSGLNPLVEHWNGTAWSVVPGPSSGTNGSSLWGVAAISAGDIWAVGIQDVSSGEQALLAHWDGSTWTVVPSPPDPGTESVTLRAVTAINTGDVWAAGYDQTSQALTQRILVEHYSQPPCQ